MMGGGGKQSVPTYTPPVVPEAPTIDTAAAERERREKDAEEERLRKRKAAIAASGRKSSILAGENEGKELLG